jgi:hypothetical protein
MGCLGVTAPLANGTCALSWTGSSTTTTPGAAVKAMHRYLFEVLQAIVTVAIRS